MIIQNLKSGLTAFILLLLISACAQDKYIVNTVYPRAYESETKLLPYPKKPDPENRTNGSMHLYRVQVENWGCEVVNLFDQFVGRVTDGKDYIVIPSECTLK